MKIPGAGAGSAKGTSACHASGQSFRQTSASAKRSAQSRNNAAKQNLIAEQDPTSQLPISRPCQGSAAGSIPGCQKSTRMQKENKHMEKCLSHKVPKAKSLLTGAGLKTAAENQAEPLLSNVHVSKESNVDGIAQAGKGHSKWATFISPSSPDGHNVY